MIKLNKMVKKDNNNKKLQVCMFHIAYRDSF